MAVYTVLARPEYNEDDPTQKSWKMEYGLRCAENGASEAFLNIDEDGIEKPEDYAESIADDIFPALKQRTDLYYSRN